MKPIQPIEVLQYVLIQVKSGANLLCLCFCFIMFLYKLKETI